MGVEQVGCCTVSLVTEEEKDILERVGMLPQMEVFSNLAAVPLLKLEVARSGVELVALLEGIGYGVQMSVSLLYLRVCERCFILEFS